jgi:hypothetical protein
MNNLWLGESTQDPPRSDSRRSDYHDIAQCHRLVTRACPRARGLCLQRVHARRVSGGNDEGATVDVVRHAGLPAIGE